MSRSPASEGYGDQALARLLQVITEVYNPLNAIWEQRSFFANPH